MSNDTRAQGWPIPIEVTSSGQGTFSGSLRIFRFAAQSNQLVASGLLTGGSAAQAAALLNRLLNTLM